MYGEKAFLNLSLISWMLGREAGIRLTGDRPIDRISETTPGYSGEFGEPTPPPTPAAPQQDISTWTPRQRKEADRVAWLRWKRTAIPPATPPPTPPWKPPTLDSTTIATIAIGAVAAVMLWRTTR